MINVQKATHEWLSLVLGAGLLLAACGDGAGAAATKKDQPAKVEKIDGTGLNRLVLTERAVQRLDIRTAPVGEATVSRRVVVVGPDRTNCDEIRGTEYRSPRERTFFVENCPAVGPVSQAASLAAPGPTLRTVIPYSAVIYDPRGDTWAYTNPEPFVYIRHHITVDFVDGQFAVLGESPPLGTQVVTAGAAELYGAEFGVGK
jgi:hypothetical protein